MQKTIRMTVWLGRRIFPVVMALLLLMAFQARAYAASEKSNSNSNSGSSKPDTKQTGKPEKKNASSEDAVETEAETQTQTQAKKTYKGISTEKIALAIDSVLDSTQKSELTELLEAYQTALGAKDDALQSKTGSMSELSQAASDARKALKQGLEEAGFTLGSVLGWQEWKEYGNSAASLETIAAAIAALDDTDSNKAALNALLAAYQDAQSALAAATEENREALQTAADDAKEALFEALFLAGLLPVEEADSAETDDVTE